MWNKFIRSSLYGYKVGMSTSTRVLGKRTSTRVVIWYSSIKIRDKIFKNPTWMAIIKESRRLFLLYIWEIYQLVDIYAPGPVSCFDKNESAMTVRGRLSISRVQLIFIANIDDLCVIKTIVCVPSNVYLYFIYRWHVLFKKRPNRNITDFWL